MRMGMRKSQYSFAIRRKVLEMWRKPNCEEMKAPTTYLIKNKNTTYLIGAAAFSFISISAEEPTALENDQVAEEKAAKAEAARIEIEKAVAAAEAKAAAEKAAEVAAAVEAARLEAEAAATQESWEKCKVAALVVFISWLVFLKTS